MTSYILPFAMMKYPPASVPCFRQPVTDTACAILSCPLSRTGNRLRNTRGTNQRDNFFNDDIWCRSFQLRMECGSVGGRQSRNQTIPAGEGSSWGLCLSLRRNREARQPTIAMVLAPIVDNNLILFGMSRTTPRLLGT